MMIVVVLTSCNDYAQCVVVVVPASSYDDAQCVVVVVVPTSSIYDAQVHTGRICCHMLTSCCYLNHLHA